MPEEPAETHAASLGWAYQVKEFIRDDPEIARRPQRIEPLLTGAATFETAVEDVANVLEAIVLKYA